MAKARGLGSSKRPRKVSPTGLRALRATTSSPQQPAAGTAYVKLKKKKHKTAHRAAAEPEPSKRRTVPGVNMGKIGGYRFIDDDWKGLGVDPFDPESTVEELFGDLAGGAQADAIIEFYSIGFGNGAECNVPWYFYDDSNDRKRTIVRSPFSRELQQDTVLEYQVRMGREGLSQRVSGPIPESQ